MTFEWDELSAEDKALITYHANEKGMEPRRFFEEVVRTILGGDAQQPEGCGDCPTCRFNHRHRMGADPWRNEIQWRVETWDEMSEQERDDTLTESLKMMYDTMPVQSS